MLHDDGEVPFSEFGSAGSAVLRAAELGLALNIFLAAAKIAAGVIGTSQAMLADGLHSSADAAAALAVAVGVRIGRRPPDADHPHGHAKAEGIAALMVGVVLAVAGLEIGFESIVSLWARETAAPGRVALLVAGLSIVLKESMYRYQSWVARREGSAALTAAAAEHRTCALKTVITFFSVYGARFGLRWLDPAAGSLIAVFVVSMAARITARAIDTLMDRVDPRTAGAAPAPDASAAPSALNAGPPSLGDSSSGSAPPPPL